MIIDPTLDHIIISYMFEEKQHTLQLTNSIDNNYFVPDIRWLYDIIEKHFTNPKFKEIPTDNIINEYLQKKYSDQEFIKKSLDTVKKIREIPVVYAEFSWYVEKLKYRYNEQVQRVAVKKVAKILQDGSLEETNKVDNVNRLLKESIVQIDSIHRKEAYEEGNLGDSAKDRFSRYKEVKENPDIAKGVMSGLSELDKLTNGFHPGELILVGGDTGTGKSIFMQNVALNAYLNGYDVFGEIPNKENIKRCNILYFSLEMPKSGLEMRADACMAGIDFRQIRDGCLDEYAEKQYYKLLNFQNKFSNKFHIVDMPRNVTVREIELKFLELQDCWGYAPDFVVVDYIGIMSPTTTIAKDSDWLSLGRISQEMHEFAREYKIPVLSATQLNRPKDPSKAQYSTSRIARSNMIPDNANVILQIGNRGEDESDRGDMPIYIVKMRDGPKGQFMLMKDFSKMKITNFDGLLFDGDDDDDI